MCSRAFSRDIKAAILVFRNKETAVILVGIERHLYAKSSFVWVNQYGSLPREWNALLKWQSYYKVRSTFRNVTEHVFRKNHDRRTVWPESEPPILARKKLLILSYWRKKLVTIFPFRFPTPSTILSKLLVIALLKSDSAVWEVQDC